MGTGVVQWAAVISPAHHRHGDKARDATDEGAGEGKETRAGTLNDRPASQPEMKIKREQHYYCE